VDVLTGEAPAADDPESGLRALAMLLGFHRIAADPQRLRHELGHAGDVEGEDMVRLARRLPGVRAKAISVSWERLARLPLPAIARVSDGWLLLVRADEQGVLIQRPGMKPASLDRAGFETMWTGDIVLVTARETLASLTRTFDVRWFIPQVVRYRRLIGEVLLITLALNLLGLAAPLFFQAIVDKVLVHDTLATLQVLAIGFVGVSIWEVAFGWLRVRLYSETSQKIDVELGARLFRHLLSLPLGYFEARRVGDTVTRIRQLETIREFLTNASLSVLVDPAFVVVFLAAMWLYSPHLFWVVALTIPAYALISLIFTRPMRMRLNEKFERGSASNALLIETVSGVHTLKAAAVEPQWQSRWERQLAAYSSASQRATMLGATGGQAVQLVSKLSLAAILYFGAKEVIAGSLTIGGLVAFNMLAQRVSSPVIRMAQLWQDFQQVGVAIERMGDILNQPAEPAPASPGALPAIGGAIRFAGVRFRYHDEGAWVLDDIDLDIAAGTSLGIVGSSGSGKSTLTRLVQRLHAPAAGRVLVDGIDIAHVDPSWLRRQIGVVLQENLLFNRSIRENIALSQPAAPIAAVMAAARMAGAHDFIVGLPSGYDTLVEERGANLSGGQRQRIAIARALLTQPRILILDEATSALDAESEEIVQRNLRMIAQGRTLIIVAHRLSAIRQCDRIVTLERGRIVESGDHEQLLRQNGRYAELHRRQLGLVA
jgi:ATP-binding cassette, subfamily B, bacterial HlyB/CyaB